jgi:glycosyltransferase involved in cell wall biosynthesis
MRVLKITGSLTRSAGGLFYSVSGLATALSSYGVQVAVWGVADEFFSEDKDVWANVELLPQRASAYGMCLDGILRSMTSKPDVVHVHGVWYAGSVFGRIFQLRGIPVIVSPHGMLDPWILKRRKHIKALHAALFERPLMSRGVSHALNRSELLSIQRFLGSDAGEHFVIPNGITKAAPFVRTHQSGVLYLGRLHEKKQTIELVEFWRRSARLRSIPLVVAGWGDPKYTALLVRAVSGAENVTFVGPLHGDAKVDAFLGARAFILPSLSEGLPMAALEALEFGCVPILTDFCNLPELFRDGIAVRMEADFSDLEAIVAEVLGQSEDALNQWTAQCVDYSKRYEWSNVARSVLDGYLRIVGS